MKTQIIFAVDPNLKTAGSTELRVFQLISLLEEFHGTELTFSVSSLPKPKHFRQAIWALRQPVGSVVIFSKWSLLRLRQNTLDILRRKGVRTCIDYVDIDLREALKFNPDVHLAASISAHTALKNLTTGQRSPEAKIMLLHHNLDARMYTSHSCPNDRPRPVYFGALENTVITPTLRNRVTFIRADKADEISELFRRLADFNIHYCIRQTNSTSEVIAKPFTKGFVASQMGVPVLVSNNVDDALALLGKDYPFTIKDTTEVEILKGLENVCLAFGGREWAEATERVLDLQRLCSRKAIAHQFMEIISELR